MKPRCRHVCSRIPIRLAGVGLALTLSVYGSPVPTAVAPKPLLVDLDAPPPAKMELAVRKALRAPLLTVVDKPGPSPTGDPHDYVSYARYFWPDPARPGGLPFLRHDGRVNGEQVNQGDRGRLGRFVGEVSLLSLAWSQEHRTDCARRAGDWIRAWLLTPATRMNPNLDYGQVRLGHNHNRGNPTGVLDARGLADVVDALRLLHGSPALTPAEESAVRRWFMRYDEWLDHSPQARREHEARNNHGSWYLVQAVAIARYLGRDDEARALCLEDERRIAWQIAPDGSQPLELARQDALSYSVFNLQAQLRLARLARGLGIDLWRYTAPSGASLEKALDSIRPYNEEPSRWPGRQLARLRPGYLNPLLAQAAALGAAGS